ncbi:interferon-induced GTP-binding protein Mx [Verticillium alfalfae VaMs.102]|uniref:Interferon-induced GTP-binding protein Mx n=1 Tax=Verticillium alfalfae (strain VaMs.102 / ATCC MYA-4576 / FGSC 10136) TaxID=526221 RepID=C9SU10_VERA1|nr:interferon-induced GTP-binding protein Mx [Verticillium alfalfae VaMs.102]EEY22321.1 interferon-induced GTP-binding protein Mx [Verticillium alfalfae VaMs.102]
MATTVADNVALDASAMDDLNSPEAKALLDTIDKLRSINVGDIISLPQIIVVGDQSSGKSSVLEAISRVPFPVKGDLCTRFATELVLRRSSSSYVHVTIRFAKGSSGDQEPFHREELDLSRLPSLIEEATERMGIRPGSDVGFSRDVLRIEVSGPDVPSLTLVDLPGFYHSSTGEQSLEGIKVVNRLVKSYMAQEQSIILAVLSASTQLASQRILDEAREHDPKRLRTLGVITKPDVPKPGLSNEAKYLQLARNEEPRHQLTLGWHVLRNRAEDEGDVTADERDATEAKFFETGAWAYFPPGNKGIGSFRRKLGKGSSRPYPKTLPGLVSAIERASRTGRHTQAAGLGILYAAEMRATSSTLRRSFSASRDASRVPPYPDDEGHEPADSSRRPTWRDVAVTGRRSAAGHLQEALEYFQFPEPEPVFEEALKTEMGALAAANQGREFPGSPNTDLAIQMFRRRPSPGRGIAERHLDVVTELSKSFVEQLFEHIIGDDKTTLDAILHSCVDVFFEKKKKELKAKLDELLLPYEAGFGMPLVAEFNSTMSIREVERVTERVVDVLQNMGSALAEGIVEGTMDRYDVARTVQKTPSLRDEFGIDQTIDNMETYYEMSRRTFTENVAYLALESCLITRLPDILTPGRVNRMEDERVEELALESEDVLAERKMVQTQADLLKNALAICRRHRPRGSGGGGAPKDRQGRLSTTPNRDRSMADAHPAPMYIPSHLRASTAEGIAAWLFMIHGLTCVGGQGVQIVFLADDLLTCGTPLTC